MGLFKRPTTLFHPHEIPVKIPTIQAANHVANSVEATAKRIGVKHVTTSVAPHPLSSAHYMVHVHAPMDAHPARVATLIKHGTNRATANGGIKHSATDLHSVTRKGVPEWQRRADARAGFH